jgi:hypothetical protein
VSFAAVSKSQQAFGLSKTSIGFGMAFKEFDSATG